MIRCLLLAFIVHFFKQKLCQIFSPLARPKKSERKTTFILHINYWQHHLNDIAKFNKSYMPRIHLPPFIKTTSNEFHLENPPSQRLVYMWASYSKFLKSKLESWTHAAILPNRLWAEIKYKSNSLFGAVILVTLLPLTSHNLPRINIIKCQVIAPLCSL